ncbi:sensor histidine kinase [Haloplanus rallus]|jgi:signal transduction histidine kinase|uniref:histidine kinase n=1 Tax=Haloplanus rallus TaxID=1816183 RepID=A0A6B9F0S2_9EURY|nr:HAMP domain-containing sensor histidine kinase [Haloplanus rallus]QGX93708.1 sensor histidine kinase [Haloplanus rallus]
MTDECTAAIPLEAFPDPVLAYAVDGGEARITTTNEAFERRFGDTSSDAHVSTVFERFSHRTATGDRDPITHVVRGDRVGIYLDGNGNRGAFFLRVVPSDEDAGYLVFSDLQQCPAIEEMPAVDQVSSVISHDLRNPLDVAKAHLQAARETGEPEHFESVADAHDRMERIIRDVLTLTRGDAVVDPSERVSIETAATDAWQSVDTGGAVLELVGSLPTVTADSDRVRRLFENLFRNAVKHNATDSRRQYGDSGEHGSTSHRSQTPDDGTEHDSAAIPTQSEGSVTDDSDTPSPNTREHGGERRPGPREQSPGDGTTPEKSVTITVGSLGDGFYVADDGRGIPTGERETVFKPGYSTMAGGTGLGLAIVERIIVAHDWNITLTAADCGGARFEIRFEHR